MANYGFARALLQEAGAHGATVTLVILPNRPFTPASAADPNYRLIADRFGFATDVVAFAELPRLLRERPVDVLHELDPHMHRGLYIRNNVAGYPIVVTGVTHSLSHATFHEWMLLNLLGCPQACDRLICTTPSAEAVVRSFVSAVNEVLAEHQDLATETIPHGVFVDDYSSATGSIRDQYDIPSTAVVLLAVGRFDRYMKVDLLPLLVAFKRVVQRTSSDTRLLLAGATTRGDYPRSLRSSISELRLEDRVLVVENPSEPHKRELYASADLFVALADNFQETFGLTLLEAAAAGLPVVASSWDGYKALVEDGKTGYLVPTLALRSCPTLDVMAPLVLNSTSHFLFSQSVATDLDLLTDRLVALIENPRERKELAANARHRARRQFDWKHVIERYMALWARLADQRDRCAILPGRPPSLDFRKAFRGYPTSFLGDADTVITTEAGERVIRFGEPLRLYGELQSVMSAPIFERILTLSLGGADVGALCVELGASAPRELVEFHIIWLLKYGLLSLRR